MATEATPAATGSTEETSGQESTEQQQTPPAETAGKEEAPVKIDDSTQLPETHPLVKTLATLKTKTASQTSELTELRSKSAKVTKLEEELAARPTTEAVETLQTRYDRLEAFIQQAGGSLGKALDSRTFTRDLFETDKDVAEIVKEWSKNNPSATTTALASAAAAPGASKVDPNTLLRAAFKG